MNDTEIRDSPGIVSHSKETELLRRMKRQGEVTMPPEQELLARIRELEEDLSYAQARLTDAAQALRKEREDNGELLVQLAEMRDEIDGLRAELRTVATRHLSTI